MPQGKRGHTCANRLLVALYSGQVLLCVFAWGPPKAALSVPIRLPVRHSARVSRLSLSPAPGVVAVRGYRVQPGGRSPVTW